MKEIPLSRGLVALVDDADYDRLTAMGSWYADPGRHTFYARKNIYHPADRSFTHLFMHNVITGWPYVDHRNGDGLDNRLQRRSGKWMAYITLNRRQRYLGTFTTPESAARAYDAAPTRLFGEFARLNFPGEST
jgi:hypothetical protein